MVLDRKCAWVPRERSLMPQNLSSQFAQLAQRRWNREDREAAMAALSQEAPSFQLDYDRAAGEEWATWFHVDQSKEVAALICMVVPLAFVVKRFSGECLPVLIELAVECVTVNDIYDADFSLDPGLLETVFPIVRPEVDWTHFSAQDLWWATI